MRTAILFGIPSIIAVFLTRAYLLPAIPDNIFVLYDFKLTKGLFLLLLFALLMIIASYSMIRRRKRIESIVSEEKDSHYAFTFCVGAFIGVLTGLVGAGGGFLIIPTLVIINRLPMKEAVGTSLLIIATKSLIGFWGGNLSAVDWIFLLKIIALAIAGIFIGVAISKRVKGAKLKPAFGWFVLLVGVYIIVRELFLK